MRGEEDVGGLEVAVHDAAGVERLQGGKGLERHLHRILQGQGSAPQPLGERPPLEQLHGDEEAALVLAHLVELADVEGG